MILEFKVFGVAQQMGSKKAFIPKGRTWPVITDTNKNLKQWQLLVTERAQHAIAQLPQSERTLLEDGVRVTVAFYLPRPKTLPKRVTAHTKSPDIDKLQRGLFDALTNIVFRDDAQICDLIAMKRYAVPGAIPSVEIRVEPSAGVVPLAVDQPLFTERVAAWLTPKEGR